MVTGFLLFISGARISAVLRHPPEGLFSPGYNPSPENAKSDSHFKEAAKVCGTVFVVCGAVLAVCGVVNIASLKYVVGEDEEGGRSATEEETGEVKSGQFSTHKLASEIEAGPSKRPRSSTKRTKAKEIKKEMKKKREKGKRREMEGKRKKEKKKKKRKGTKPTRLVHSK